MFHFLVWFAVGMRVAHFPVRYVTANCSFRHLRVVSFGDVSCGNGGAVLESEAMVVMSWWEAERAG